MALPYDDPRRDQLIDQALAEVPDDLIAELTQEAAGHLWLKCQRPL
jgi:outer membrane protein TolC